MTREQWLENEAKIDKALRRGLITTDEGIAKHEKNDAAYDWALRQEDQWRIAYDRKEG